MRDRRSLLGPPLFCLALACGGCGGRARSDASGPGDPVAVLAHAGGTVSVSADGDDVYAILLESTIGGVPLVSIQRYRDGGITEMPFQVNDWSDWSASGVFPDNPAQTALVSGGKAYFMGAYGVTVAPLDGTPGATFYPPPGGPSGNMLGSFAADSTGVYFERGNFDANTLSLLRFDPSGGWTELFTTDPSGPPESGLAGAAVADQGTLYWSTTRAIRAYSEADGTVRTVVALAGEALAPPLLTVSGDTLVWFDFLDAGLHAVDKTSSTPDDSASLGATTILRLDGSDPGPYALVGTPDHAYWLSVVGLHELPIHGDLPSLKATGSTSAALQGLAAAGSDLYFTTVDFSDGGLGEVTFRSVSQ